MTWGLGLRTGNCDEECTGIRAWGAVFAWMGEEDLLQRVRKEDGHEGSA